MEKIVIDTNVLYSWVEISPNDKLPSASIEAMLTSHELYLSTPSIIEFLIRHRNNLDNIKKCLTPIIERKATPIGIGFMPVSNDILKKLYAAKTIEDVSDDIDALFKMKIQKEAEFLRFFWCVLWLVFFLQFVKRGSINFRMQSKIICFLTWHLLR